MTYDQIGNRVTETKDSLPQETYVDIQNSGLRSTPILDEIQANAATLRDYQSGFAGHLERVTAGMNEILFTSNAEGRLSRLNRAAGDARSELAYDGRSFLSQAEAGFSATVFSDGFETGDVRCWSGVEGDPSPPAPENCNPFPETLPAYSSHGVLMAVAKDPGQTGELTRTYFYFAGRPVAQLDHTPGGTETWRWLTVDHLGTPVMATDLAGTVLWQGGLEPFGRDWSGAEAAEIDLRFPGQWEDESWTEASLGSEVYYNVHRWYETGAGRYLRVDPLGLVNPSTFSPRSALGSVIEMVYGYAELNPLLRLDSLGLRSRVCCRRLAGGVLGGAAHCFIQIETEEGTTTCSLIRAPERGTAYIHRGPNDLDDPGKSNCGPWNEQCGTDRCVVATSNDYANPSEYHFLGGGRGANSNTFAGYIARNCGLSRPGGVWAPGWDRRPLASPVPGKDQGRSPCALP